MPKFAIVLLLLSLFCVSLTPARAELNDRLSQQRYGVVTSGNFSAGGTVHFTLRHYRDEYLMHFAGDQEIYVLYGDSSSLGGRVLRYDSGAVAIRITGWGAMTVYTDQYPEGLPVDKVGPASELKPGKISQSELISRAEDESAHLAYIRSIHIRYTADWAAYADDPAYRALIFDTLENTARGIMRFTSDARCRTAFARHILRVQFNTSRKPTIQYRNHVLIVTFNPHTGYVGRASSRAIAFALGKMFHIPFSN